MERLTYRDSSVPHRDNEGETVEAYSDYDIRKIINRLAAYEDTGLAPEEFKESVDFVLELNKKLIVYKDLDARPEEIADILAFCKENGFKNLVDLLNAIATDRPIVLPCKVGDTVWSGEPFVDKHIREGSIVQINIDAFGFCGFWASFHPGAIAAEFIKEDIGETVFLTREEAEAALAKEAHNGE